MHAPLARHLVRFARPPAGASAVPPVSELAPDAPEPMVTMTVAAFEAQLDAAREALRMSLSAAHALERDQADIAHVEALAGAVAAAAARRDAEEAAALAAQIASAAQALRYDFADQLARTLRPLLAEAVAARTTAALVETVAQVLADPDHPPLTIRGPAALLATVEAALAGECVTFEAIDADELSVTGNGIRIETRLATTLAALAATEGT